MSATAAGMHCMFRLQDLQASAAYESQEGAVSRQSMMQQLVHATCPCTTIPCSFCTVKSCVITIKSSTDLLAREPMHRMVQLAAQDLGSSLHDGIKPCCYQGCI
jgi:hypothetical protein